MWSDPQPSALWQVGTSFPSLRFLYNTEHLLTEKQLSSKLRLNCNYEDEPIWWGAEAESVHYYTERLDPRRSESLLKACWKTTDTTDHPCWASTDTNKLKNSPAPAVLEVPGYRINTKHKENILENKARGQDSSPVRCWLPSTDAWRLTRPCCWWMGGTLGD